MRARWTNEQDTFLRERYADTPMAELMGLLHRSQRAIHLRAFILGLHRSEKYLAAIRIQSGFVAHQFKKGNVSPNKGKKRSDFKTKESEKRWRTTQFKQGHIPHNARPVGYERVYSDGYVHIKVEGMKRMQLKHRYVWQQHYGEIPQGMCVAFRDGNRQNCDISNLMLITEAEKATRVLASLTPEQKQAKVLKTQATRNETIRKDKMRIRWGLEPKTKLVKKYYKLK